MLEEHRLLFRLYGALPPGVEGPRHGEGSRHGQSPSAECKPGERSRKISPPSSHEKVSTGAREEDALLKTSVSFLMLKSFKRARNARLIQDCPRLCTLTARSHLHCVLTWFLSTVLPQDWAPQLCCRAQDEPVPGSQGMSTEHVPAEPHWVVWQARFLRRGLTEGQASLES